MKISRKTVLIIVGVLLLALAAGGAAAAHYLPNRLVESVTHEIGSAESVPVESFLLYENDTAEYVTDMTQIDLNKLGTHDIEVQVHGFLKYPSILHVVDTTLPEVTLKDINVGFGQELTPEDFIVKATDNTELTHAFKNPIDEKKDTQEIIIVTKDIAENTVETTAKLSFYNVITSITKELGTTKELVPEDFLTSKESTIEIKFISTPEEIEAFKVGENTIKLLVNNEEVTSKVIVEDTTAPTATAASPTFYKDYAISVKDFIAEYFDLSEVTITFKDNKAPAITKSGTFNQIIVLTDEHGNSTEVSATYTVLIDEEDPVISGAKDLEIIIGEPFNLRGGTYVRDNVDTEIRLVVDSSKVNVEVEGTYPLIYKATDKSGNSAQQEVTVKVRKRLPYQPMGDTGNATLNAMVDSILGSIIHGEMSLYQKTQKIYNFGTTIRYAAGDVTLGYATDAINTLRSRIGNCFGRMHAMEALFDRAGIPNREQIQYKREHSWNQVNIGNGWQNIDSGFGMFLVSHETLKANEYRYTHIDHLWSITDPALDEPVPSVVKINYLEDGSRKVLHPQEVRNGVLGEQYTSKAVVIPGYKLRFQPHNASGIFNRDETNVNYMYVIDETQTQVDKTLLKAAIDKATAMSVDPSYKPSYQTQLKNALVTANQIYTAYTSTQQMVDGQTSNLNTIMASPQKTADKSVLTAKISEANTYINQRAQYDAASIKVLETAVANANAVVNNTEATQAEVNNHVTTIQNAINGLKKLDRTVLKATIDRANALDKTPYQLSALTTLNTAITNATTVLNNSNSQSEINSANATLASAITTFEASPKIDKSALQTKLNEALAINQAEYTATSVATLNNAINNANNVMKAIVNQSDVTAAINSLDAAIAGLEKAPIVNKTNLVAAIAQAQSIDRSLYTPESLVVLDSALANAIAINDNPTALQPDIDNATAVLNDAYGKLSPIVVEPIPQP